MTLANVLVDYFIKGGPIMWPILVAVIVAVTVILQRCAPFFRVRGYDQTFAWFRLREAVA